MSEKKPKNPHLGPETRLFTIRASVDPGETGCTRRVLSPRIAGNSVLVKSFKQVFGLKNLRHALEPSARLA
jgi:hypothetical protein